MRRTDHALMADIASGDDAACTVLFRRHYRRALSEATKYSSRKSSADDAVSVAFQSVFQGLRDGRQIDHFRSYLLTSVRNSLINQSRSRSASEVPVADIVESAHDDATAAPAEPFGGAMQRAFDSLTERHQAAIWATEVEGRSNREIAKALGLQANAVAALTLRARRSLRTAYIAELTAGVDVHEWVGTRLEAMREKLAISVEDQMVVQFHAEDCRACAARRAAAVPVGAGAYASSGCIGAALLLAGVQGGAAAAPVGFIAAGFGVVRPITSGIRRTAQSAGGGGAAAAAAVAAVAITVGVVAAADSGEGTDSAPPSEVVDVEPSTTAATIVEPDTTPSSQRRTPATAPPAPTTPPTTPPTTATSTTGAPTTEPTTAAPGTTPTRAAPVATSAPPATAATSTVAPATPTPPTSATPTTQVAATTPPPPPAPPAPTTTPDPSTTVAATSTAAPATTTTVVATTTTSTSVPDTTTSTTTSTTSTSSTTTTSTTTTTVARNGFFFTGGNGITYFCTFGGDRLITCTPVP